MIFDKYTSMAREYLTEKNVGVVSFVILSNPASHKSPDCFHSGVRAKSSGLLGLSAYSLTVSMKIYKRKTPERFNLPSWGLDQRCLGASLAVKGV